MSDRNPFEQVAIELAAIRRELAELHQERGTRLSRGAVLARLGVHRNTLRTYIDKRGFPAPCQDGSWLLSEVIEWEATKR